MKVKRKVNENVMARKLQFCKLLRLPWTAVWLLVICGTPVYLVVAEFSPCVTPYDWANGGSVDVFFMVSMVPLVGSWCYSREWVWNLRTKLCCIAPGKWNVSTTSVVGVMVSKSDLQCSDIGSFPEWGGYELAFQFFLGF